MLKKIIVKVGLATCLSFMFTCQVSLAQQAQKVTFKKNKAVLNNQAAIASAHPFATQAGLEILSQGGNAFDAAIAVTTVLAVVEPYSSGLGGGGFYLLKQTNKNAVMLDARERAPLSAHNKMYLDDDNNVIKNASINGAFSAGIPGIPAAIVRLAKDFGHLQLSQSMASAINYAKNGFAVDAYYQKMAGFRLSALQQNKTASDIFLQNNEVPKLGYMIVQKNLAKTLEKIATQGFDGFYNNETAKLLLSDVTKNGGIWQQQDLADYRIKYRGPMISYYKGMKLTMASLPSSGGVVISEIVNILSSFDIEKMNKVKRTHLIVEAMRRAYRDRAQYMGDSDYVDVPIDKLMSQTYAKKLAASIKNNRATKSEHLKAYAQPSGAGTDTTHFSIVDKAHNIVSATLSINYPFGSCYVAKGTGVLLNDEMDDFAAKPGVANVYGLVGSAANSIEAGKRMLSSMTPTILQTKDKIAVIGTPGGSRIISMVLLGLLDFYQNKSAKEIVNAGRFHHQYLPDEISYEPTLFNDKEVAQLEKMGHKVNALNSDYGNMQVIIIDKKTAQLDAASDSRGIGEAKVLSTK